MKPKQAVLADGTVLEFPADTADDVIDRTVKNHVTGMFKIGKEGLSQAAEELGKDKNLLQKAATGIGNAAFRSAAALGNIPSILGAPKMVEQEALDVGQATQRGAGPVATTANVLTNLVMALGVPGAFSTAPRAMASSAALEPEDRATAAILSGALNVGSRALTGSLVSPTQTTKGLLDQGVVPTYGQNAASGTGFKNKVVAGLEEKMQSVPFVGDFITNARLRALDDFRKAALNKAAPPGAKITETGDEGVKQLKDAFKAGYGDVYKGHTFKPDFQMVQDMAAAPGNLTVPLSNEAMKKYWGTVNNVLSRIPMGGLPARNVKGTIEADLGQAGRGLQASLVKEEQDLGKAILGARDALRDSMKRSLPPADAAKLAPLDAAYPNYAAVRSASDRAKAQLGAFSPNQLQRSAPQGSALRELADMGQAALPTRLPNSFSADRGLMAGLLGFLGPAASGAATGNPYLLGASLAPLMYSRPFMMYEMGRWTPDLVRQMSPGAAQGLLYGMQQPLPQE